ncbi:MAG: hypothetical protein AB4206_13930 [Xenococcaceae cyanobacterium]
MVKTKANQKIHIDKLKTTLEKLGQLKEKPKEELTLRESIYFLRDKLKSALKKGYSYQDLSEILEEQQIRVSASTLKQYLTEINKESASRRKKSKSGQSQSTKSKSTASTELSQKSDKDATLSKAESNIDLNKALDISLEKSDKSLSTVESNNVKESSKSTPKKQSVTSRSKSRTSTKTKTKKSSGSNQDLSSDFNQY